jgi:hypothetical protein
LGERDGAGLSNSAGASGDESDFAVKFELVEYHFGTPFDSVRVEKITETV